jgi:alpha-D-ribose 1-methylphosphonate 5-triphosphate synthase subunit PhnG
MTSTSQRARASDQAPAGGSDHSEEIAARRAAMAIVAGCDTAELARLVATLGELPDHEDLRRPESGLVMVRGRIGGDGSPFNLGEASVTRAAVRLDTGEVGFGYVLGRDQHKARLAALCDALWQSTRHRALLEQRVLDPIAAHCALARRAAAERTAATRVEFFTLVRGED